MTDPANDADLLLLAKRELDERARNLDADTLSRLRAARRHALRGHRRQAPWGWPAGAIAAACALLLAVALWPHAPSGERPAAALEDLDLLTGAEPLDLLEELEFYGWLAEHDQRSG